MLLTEWRRSSDWIPHRVSKYRWLLIHHLEAENHDLEDWSDEDSEDELSADDTIPLPGTPPPHPSHNNSKPKFGPLPRFTRVYEVKVCPDKMVFGCTCSNQGRMGMPCRHIAAICIANEFILGKDPTGFPLSSVRIFWWNQYYLYGLSKRPDHQKSKEALIALSKNDTLGLPCPDGITCPTDCVCPTEVFDAFYTPATHRLLNYTGPEASAAVQQMKDRNNAYRFPDPVPAGLSQVSHLQSDSDNEEFEEWNHGLEELSDTEEYQDSRKVLSRHYNELSEAFTNARDKESLEDEFMKVMNDFIVRARGTAAVSPSKKGKGKRVSMLPPSSQRKTTHGTKHY
jgi:hypothetical protein